MKNNAAGLLLVLLMLGVGTFGIASLQGPDPLPEDTALDHFSADRAWHHLEEIARAPHPMGSAEHARVRSYLVGELEAMGFEPTVQAATVLTERFDGSLAAGRVHNVLARLLGRQQGKAVLLMAHYDSVPAGPGAGDDASGVAALVETLRALRAGPPLENDVIVLLTDGEEAELFGVRAFVAQHAWARDVGVVFNFEARGHRGPVLMFETSDGNARLIDTLREVDTLKTAFSYGYEIYKRMPNDTDFSVTRRAGMTGMNFAFMHGLNRYHTQLDDLERLDRRSLQHQGELALGLTRLFGEADLTSDWQGGDNAIFFHLPGPIFVAYPEGMALPLVVVLWIGTILLWLAGRRQGRWQVGALLKSLLFLMLAAFGLGGLLLPLAGQLMNPFYSFSLWNGWNSTLLTLLAIGLLAATVWIGLYSLPGRKLGEHLFLAGCVVWLALATVTAMVVPGASYLFAGTLLMSLVVGWLWLKRDAEAEKVSWGLFLVMAFNTVLITALWAPSFSLIGVALGPPTAVVIGVFGTLLLWGPLVLQLALLSPSTRRGLAVVAILLAVILAVSVRMASRYDEVNRRPNTIFYLLDTESGEASWHSFDRAIDSFTAQFLGGKPERRSMPEALKGRGFFGRTLLHASAPRAELGAAVVQVLDERVEGETRALTLHVHWPFVVDRGLLNFKTEADLRAISLGDQRIERLGSRASDDAVSGLDLAFYAPPPEGLKVHIELVGDQPLIVETVGQSYHLPQLADFSYKPRGNDMMPNPWRVSDSTLVRGVVTLEPGSGTTATETEEAEAADEG